MGRLRGVAGCVLGAAAVQAAQFGSATLAHGATAAVVTETLEDCCDGKQRIAVVRIAAGPAEANDVTVATTSEGVRVRDRGVPLIAGAGCVAAADGGAVHIPAAADCAAGGRDRVTTSCSGQSTIGSHTVCAARATCCPAEMGAIP
jgi:hypothetical protein